MGEQAAFSLLHRRSLSWVSQVCVIWDKHTFYPSLKYSKRIFFVVLKCVDVVSVVKALLVAPSVSGRRNNLHPS